MRAGRERRKSDLIYLSCCYSLAIRGKPFPISLSPLIKLSVWVGRWVAAWDNRSLGADKPVPMLLGRRMHKVAKSQRRERGPDRYLLVSSSSLLSIVHSVQSHECKCMCLEVLFTYDGSSHNKLLFRGKKNTILCVFLSKGEDKLCVPWPAWQKQMENGN